MPNICMFCDRERVPDDQHRMLVLTGGPESQWVEFGADCCGDEPLLFSIGDDGTEQKATPNEVWRKAQQEEKQRINGKPYPPLCDMVTIHTGGARTFNPDYANAWAWVAFSPKGKVINQASGLMEQEDMSGITSEYTAIIQALWHTLDKSTVLAERGLGVLVRTDSKAAYWGITEKEPIHQDAYVVLAEQVNALVERLLEAGIAVRFEWVLDEENTAADKLARQELKRAQKPHRIAA